MTQSRVPGPTPAASFRSLRFVWPDGTVALDGIDGTLPRGVSGLVGANGSGKSTLLRLIAGELAASAGSVEVSGTVAYLPQSVVRAHDLTVADLLGVGDTLQAIRCVESGDVDQRHFDIIGDNWDIEHRSAEALGHVGLGSLGLDRTVATLSGGEATLVAITGVALSRSDLTLLDEPTNNLDRRARGRVAELVQAWPRTLIVVSHDRELLERVGHTVELYRGGLTTFGGPYSEWRAALDAQQAAAAQAARTASEQLKREKRQRQDAEVKLARRARTAKATARDGGIPKILQGYRANRAEGSASSLRGTHERRVADAQATLDSADGEVRTAEHIRIDLVDPELGAGRRVAEFGDGQRTHLLFGPNRLAVVGANGVGKTTMIESFVRDGVGTACGVHATRLVDRVAYLPQRLDHLDDDVSALENLQRVAPGVTSGVIKNRLARLLLRGDAVHRPVATLSGGERFRVALATMLFADPIPQLLVFDEPTNNLDIDSVDRLVEALEAYRGAVLVISHDLEFLSRLGIRDAIELDSHGLKMVSLDTMTT